jgi:hypothetical protein
MGENGIKKFKKIHFYVFKLESSLTLIAREGH